MPAVSGRTRTTVTTYYRYTRDELLKALGFTEDEIARWARIDFSPALLEGEPGGRPWTLVITFEEVEEH